MSSTSQMGIATAMDLLKQVRAVFSDFKSDEDSLCLAAAARRLDVSVDWMRDHVAEFPNAWRLPAGEVQRNGEAFNIGELRIPVKDILALQERQRTNRIK